MADTAVAEAPAAKERPHRSFWAELPILVLIALVAAILIKTFLAQAFYIPSTSMLPCSIILRAAHISAGGPA